MVSGLKFRVSGLTTNHKAKSSHELHELKINNIN